MSDKILCPWCGAEMEEHLTFVSGRGRKEFKCPKCSAKSPPEETREQARAAAMHRYTPQIKPMTLEEVLWTEGEIYVEYEGEFDTWACRCFINSTTEEVTVHCIEMTETLDFSAYNCTWRCWSRKPTDEERSAAEWEI